MKLLMFFDCFYEDCFYEVIDFLGNSRYLTWKFEVDTLLNMLVRTCNFGLCLRPRRKLLKDCGEEPGQNGGSWRSEIGVKRFTCPGNHENLCLLIFAESKC